MKLLTALLVCAAISARAQPVLFKVLTSFDPSNGANPHANLVEGSDGSFYGTSDGGLYGQGTVFRVTTNGALTTLAYFNSASGAGPNGLLLGKDGSLYGTCVHGGAGTFFQVTTGGTVTAWFPFGGQKGEQPVGALALAPEGGFYGVTARGGLYQGGVGTAFKVTTDGTLTTLASFGFSGAYSPAAGLTPGGDGSFYGTCAGGPSGAGGYGSIYRLTTNGVVSHLVLFNYYNGASPQAALTLGPDGNLYGTTYDGGRGECGTVFQVTPEGALTTLASFYNTNGACPAANVTFGPEGALYGTTSLGGSNGQGTVFRMTIAGTLTTLHDFGGLDGSKPQAGLTLGRDGNFYGTTSRGGVGDRGTVFRMTPDGALTTLSSFTDSKGRHTGAALSLGNDGNLYGTTIDGGDGDRGVFFRIDTNNALVTLAVFMGTNGANPRGRLALFNDGSFYGTTYNGGSGNQGTIFRVTTNGDLTTLAAFSGTNGANPAAGLTLGKDGNFYGTTSNGGLGNTGTVFRVSTDGELSAVASFFGTNGANPCADLVLGENGDLYGTTFSGGMLNLGTVFRIETDGALTQLSSFSGSNGANPQAGLAFGNDGNLYGTTYYGGTQNRGTIFRVTTNGTLTTLLSFGGTNQGRGPGTGLTLGNDGFFYGTTSSDSMYDGYGTIFRATTNGIFTTLVSFSFSVGGIPAVGLALGKDGSYYGSTSFGGSNANGMLFSFTTRTSSDEDVARALNATNLVWSTVGNSWFVDTSTFHDGQASASSGVVLSPQQSALQAAVTGPGTLSFWWQCAFSGSSGFLSFSADGVIQNATGGPSPEWSQFTFYVPEGRHVLQWNCRSGAGGGATAWLDQVNWQPGPSPALVLTPPYDTEVTAGTNVTFLVAAGGTPRLDYQWAFNGRSIPGATGSALTVTNVQSTDVGRYGVTVTNSYGSTNASATLVVQPGPPAIWTHPAAQQAVLGGRCAFEVMVRGTEPLSYQWFFNGGPLAGATSRQLVLSSLQPTDVGSYSVAISNQLGVVVSSNATVALVPSLLIAWGENFFGQCNVPSSLTDVGAFAAGGACSTAADGTGQETHWGWYVAPFSPPAAEVVALAAATGSILALKSDGRVVAAGAILPPDLTNAVAIATGHQSSLALRDDGTVVGWGQNDYGQTNVPAGLRDVVAIAAGNVHCLALRSDGTVVAWGDNYSDQTNVPSGLGRVVGIAAGNYHSLALRSDGTVVGWGSNESGQTTPLPDLTNAVAIAAGDHHSMALRRDGTVVVWGSNTSGQTITPFNVTNVISISSGAGHCLALARNGAPHVLRFPSVQRAAAGDALTLNAGVVGIQAMTYQWQLEGVDIPGATNALLTFDPLALTNSGNYRCLATNAVGYVETPNISLAVGRRSPQFDFSPGGFGVTTNGIQLRLTGLSGHGPIVLYSSTNLFDWVAILTNPPAAGSVLLEDTQTWTPSKFYRAQEE